MSGEAFKRLSKMLGKEKGIKDPNALAASIGRKTLGKSKFQAKAAEGRHEAAEKRKG